MVRAMNWGKDETRDPDGMISKYCTYHMIAYWQITPRKQDTS